MHRHVISCHKKAEAERHTKLESFTFSSIFRPYDLAHGPRHMDETGFFIEYAAQHDFTQHHDIVQQEIQKKDIDMQASHEAVHICCGDGKCAAMELTYRPIIECIGPLIPIALIQHHYTKTSVVYSWLCEQIIDFWLKI